MQIDRFRLRGGRGLISACLQKVILTVSMDTRPLIYQAIRRLMVMHVGAPWNGHYPTQGCGGDPS